MIDELKMEVEVQICAIDENTVKPPIMDTLLGGDLYIADIFLGPTECNGLNILKPVLNGPY